MFDNGIFAYFIPQIIMVVAYVSCVFAPINQSQQTEDIVAEKFTIASELSSNVTVKTEFNFSDFNAEFQIINVDNEIHFVSQNNFVVLYNYRGFDLPERTSGCKFSRPPPRFI